MSERYGVKEVFDTLQGEGARVGQRSVFVRFSGCNLWDGHPLHRDQGEGPCAKWCDTDFFKGKVQTTEELLARMDAAWPQDEAIGGEVRWCVLTGGEPLLQVDVALLDALHASGWKVALETNGTINPGVFQNLIDHLCVSPKRGCELKVQQAHEMKVILPGAAIGEAGWTDAELEELATKVQAGRLFVQPQDPTLDPSKVELTLLRRTEEEVEPEVEEIASAFFSYSVRRCLNFIQAHPQWALSTQQHKTIGLP